MPERVRVRARDGQRRARAGEEDERVALSPFHGHPHPKERLLRGGHRRRVARLIPVAAAERLPHITAAPLAQPRTVQHHHGRSKGGLLAEGVEGKAQTETLCMPFRASTCDRSTSRPSRAG